MIHRQNWLDTRHYLAYLEDARQVDPVTIKRARIHLRHLLEWADSRLFTQANTFGRPTFPVYLLSARADGRKTGLSPASIIRCLGITRAFFAYCRVEWPGRYRAIAPSWINLLQPPRNARADSIPQVHNFWTLADVLKIARVSAETLTMREQRGQAAVALLYLSGMRADALASLPISCVDLDAGKIQQLPHLGVRTKGRKAAVTYLLDIPELMEVVRRWDQRVRSFDARALWYATIAQDCLGVTETLHAFEGRSNAIQRDVRLICKCADVLYKSPHKLRHGHVVYALKLARNMGELKAISQNVMHASVTITDQVYGGLDDDDVRSTIARLGQGNPAADDINAKLAELLELLKGRP